jgi:Domain of unknown function (DUF4232)
MIAALLLVLSLALSLALTLALALFPLPARAQGTQGTQGTQGCVFVLGFATLHDAIPQIVGSCLENEHHDAQSGDALQATTGGLLVWRKVDNWTAFTDGNRTWVQGPFGLQSRLNTQRFWWEANPEGFAITPPPAPGDRCHTAGLILMRVIRLGDAAAGHQGTTFRFTNRLSVPCTVFGYPGAQLLDGDGNALPTTVVRGNGYLFPDPGPMRVVVPSGGSTDFRLEWSDVPTGAETTCPTASAIRVTPPDEFSPLSVPVTITACAGGRLNVTALGPPAP